MQVRILSKVMRSCKWTIDTTVSETDGSFRKMAEFHLETGISYRGAL